MPNHHSETDIGNTYDEEIDLELLPIGKIVFQKRFELVEELGQGAYGRVFKAKILTDGRDGIDKFLALKFLPHEIANDKKAQDKLYQEADKLEALSHEYIINFRGIEREDLHWAIAMEYAEGGSLDSALQDCERGYFEPAEIEKWARQTLQGMDYLHSKGIIHRDFKPQNILLSAAGDVRIADFGLSGSLSSNLSRMSQEEDQLQAKKNSKKNESFKGSIPWSSPQSILGTSKPSKSDDIYGIGASLYELLTGNIPYPYANNDQHMAVQISSELSEIPPVNDRRADLYSGETGELIPTGWQRFLKAILSHQASDRPKSGSKALQLLDISPAELERLKQEKEQAEQQLREQEKKKTEQEQKEKTQQELQLKKKQALEEKARKAEQAKQRKAQRLAEKNAKLEEKRLKSNEASSSKKNHFKIVTILSILAVAAGIFLWQPWDRDDADQADVKRESDQAKNQNIQKHKTSLVRMEAPADRPSAGERRVFEIASGVKVAFRWCPATGEEGFMMGSPKSEKDRNNDETQHKVILSKGFWMAETECTQELWQAVMGENPSYLKGAQRPVEKVSWDDVQEFIEKINKKAPKGYVFKLPTEAQWEYACRAGSHGAYGGTGDLAEMGWYDSNSDSTTHPVGEKKANAWGLYDMHGNVREWCADRYGAYKRGTQTDPTVAKDGQDRVVRGGCWFSSARRSRSAYRFWIRPGFRGSSSGFRLSLQVAD